MTANLTCTENERKLLFLKHWIDSTHQKRVRCDATKQTGRFLFHRQRKCDQANISQALFWLVLWGKAVMLWTSEDHYNIYSQYDTKSRTEQQYIVAQSLLWRECGRDDNRQRHNRVAASQKKLTWAALYGDRHVKISASVTRLTYCETCCFELHKTRPKSAQMEYCCSAIFIRLLGICV